VPCKCHFDLICRRTWRYSSGSVASHSGFSHRSQLTNTQTHTHTGTFECPSEDKILRNARHANSGLCVCCVIQWKQHGRKEAQNHTPFGKFQKVCLLPTVKMSTLLVVQDGAMHADWLIMARNCHQRSCQSRCSWVFPCRLAKISPSCTRE